MWPPPTHIKRNHDSRSTNQNTSGPSNVTLIGTIPNTHESRLNYRTHQSREKVSYVYMYETKPLIN